MFTFGILENKDMKNGETQGYSLPLVSFDKNKGKTEEEEKFINMIECITTMCKDHVAKNMNQIKRMFINELTLNH